MVRILGWKLEGIEAIGVCFREIVDIVKSSKCSFVLGHKRYDNKRLVKSVRGDVFLRLDGSRVWE